MRILVPATRGCPHGNATLIPSTSSLRVPTAYCDTLLPKKRQCVAYSFGVDSVWDFDKTMVKAKCRVMSFDPFCCGAAHKIKEAGYPADADHEFMPMGMATYDGLATTPVGVPNGNITYPVGTLRSIMSSLAHPKVDVLRLKVSTPLEWKGLKNLINLGTIQEIRQLSLNMHFADNDMWEEYKTILTDLKTAGLSPFYVAKQPNAAYLKVQEGTASLHDRYEVAWGNSY